MLAWLRQLPFALLGALTLLGLLREALTLDPRLLDIVLAWREGAHGALSTGFFWVPIETPPVFKDYLIFGALFATGVVLHFVARSAPGDFAKAGSWIVGFLFFLIAAAAWPALALTSLWTPLTRLWRKPAQAAPAEGGASAAETDLATPPQPAVAAIGCFLALLAVNAALLGGV